MSLDELRQYLLTHREDLNAFYAYVDRSKASGRMITIDPADPEWEKRLEQKVRQVTSFLTLLLLMRVRQISFQPQAK